MAVAHTHSESDENEREALPFFQIVELKIYFHQLIKEERLLCARLPPTGAHDIDIDNNNYNDDDTDDDSQ